MSNGSNAAERNPPWVPMSGNMRSFTPWCVFHIETVENPIGTDCGAHLAEERMPHRCLFASIDEAKKGKCEDAANISGEAKYYDLMRTETLLEIMISDTVCKEDKVKAYNLVRDRLKGTGLFGM